MKSLALCLVTPAWCSGYACALIASSNKGNRGFGISRKSKCVLYASSKSDNSRELESFATSKTTRTISQQGEITYPVEIHHQGHTATIHVRANEPILQALERQSSSSKSSSLGLSAIPHECRRGNCLTCASRLLTEESRNNIKANVNNGLSPTMSRDLTKSGFILTCCSYITGPGVTLEIEQNEEIWDKVYRKRFDNVEQLGMEVRARAQRRLDEKNVGRWKERMEKLFDSTNDDENLI